MDVVKEVMTLMFGGRDYVKGYNATPGRMDLLCLKSWGIAEMIEPSLATTSEMGVTVMPVNPDPERKRLVDLEIFSTTTGQ